MNDNSVRAGRSLGSNLHFHHSEKHTIFGLIFDLFVCTKLEFVSFDAYGVRFHITRWVQSLNSCVKATDYNDGINKNGALLSNFIINSLKFVHFINCVVVNSDWHLYSDFHLYSDCHIQKARIMFWYDKINACIHCRCRHHVCKSISNANYLLSAQAANIKLLYH